MKLGNLDIQKLYLGGTEATKVYLGSEAVYQNTPPTPVGPTENGVYILYSDGSFSAYDTITAGKTPVGPLIITDNVSLVLHPSKGSSKQWSSNTSTLIRGGTTTTSLNIAKNDYAGAANTAVVIASGLAGSAFTFATTDCVYADGRTGYLPSCGEMEEIRLNETNINTALGLIGGDSMDFNANLYLCSTQYNASDCWYWYGPDGARMWSYGGKDIALSCRSVSAY